MSKYLVVEMQTFPDGTMSTPSYAFDSQLSAEAKYHSILASAATSALPEHTAVLMTSDGFVMESKCYQHETGGDE